MDTSQLPKKKPQRVCLLSLGFERPRPPQTSTGISLSHEIFGLPLSSSAARREEPSPDHIFLGVFFPVFSTVADGWPDVPSAAESHWLPDGLPGQAGG